MGVIAPMLNAASNIARLERSPENIEDVLRSSAFILFSRAACICDPRVASGASRGKEKITSL
jgi:hypothetical protein